MSNKTTKLSKQKEQNNTKDKLKENVIVPKEQGGPKVQNLQGTEIGKKPVGVRIFNFLY